MQTSATLKIGTYEPLCSNEFVPLPEFLPNARPSRSQLPPHWPSRHIQDVCVSIHARIGPPETTPGERATTLRSSNDDFGPSVAIHLTPVQTPSISQTQA